MILDAPTETTVGTLMGERIDMDLDRSAISHLMSVLTRLYEDTELAVIREYSTNARDSHLESGQTRPIEVRTPTPMNPVLEIQDFGLGMDIEDLRRTYSQYGASTKRESNDFNGMLGLGSKSGLAYTDQFSLESVKDGILYSIIVFKDAGNPAMKVVDSYETELPNGVKVSIPAMIYNSMEKKAREFFSYWEPGQALLNGEAPDLVQGLRVSNTFMLVKSPDRWSNQNKVLMGGVSYPTSGLQIDEVKTGWSVLANVEMGEVSFTPSREALEIDKKTNKRLIALREQFPRDLAVAAQKALQEAQTPYEAVRGALQWSDAVKFVPKVKFQGREIPESINARVRISPWDSSTLKDNILASKVEPEHWNSSLWFLGFKANQYNATHKRKALKWMEDNGLDAKWLIMVYADDLEGREWIEPHRVLRWEDVAKTVLPRTKSARTGSKAATGPGRLKGSYDVVTKEKGYSSQVEANEIDRKTRQLFYMNPGQYRSSLPALIWAGYPRATLVVMGENRMGKFKRDFSLSKYASLFYVEKSFEKWSGRVKRSHYAALAVANDRSLSYMLKKVDIDKVLDPRFKEIEKYDNFKLPFDRDVIGSFSRYGHKLDEEEFPKYTLVEDYPLLRYTSRSELVEHQTLYVNAVWTANQEKI